ncbi:LptF/LptG family permease [soil metagenome]
MFFRIFDRYIWKQIAFTTLTGVLVLTGVMVLGNVFKEMQRLLGDTSSLPFLLILKFISYIIPYSLIFTIPWALLTAILLVFGRMSADNEMTALRMTGMSMTRICAPVFVLAVILSSVCYFVNVELAPIAKTKVKRLFYDLTLDDPAMLFQPGKVLDKFPGYRIYTRKRDGNKLQDVEIIETINGGRKASRYIRAQRAEVEITPGVTDFILRLHSFHLETTDDPNVDPPDLINALRSVDSKEMAITFPLSKLKEKTERINSSMKDTSSLWSEVQTGANSVDGIKMTKQMLSASKTELSMRYSFSFAALVFTLIGIPLAITAQRRETSIGFALSLIVAVSYIFIIIFANTVNEQASLYPHLLMWLPNIIFIFIGWRLFNKLSRR